MLHAEYKYGQQQKIVDAGISHWEKNSASAAVLMCPVIPSTMNQCHCASNQRQAPRQTTADHRTLEQLSVTLYN